MELDLTDRKILYYLDKNAREPISVLAKRLRLGRNVILYRVNRLKEKGIIKGSYAEINNPLLGYMSFRIFIKLGNCSSEKETELFDFLKKQNNILWLSKVLGKWDLNPLFMTKSIKEFETFRQDLFLRFNSIIEDSEVSMLTHIYYYPKDYLIGPTRQDTTATILSIQDETKYTADDKDEELLRLLTKDAMLSLVELSSKLKLSVNTVKVRMRNLEKNNIILGYRLFIDTDKLGLEYYKLHITLRNYSKQDLSSLRAWLASNASVIYTDHHMNAQAFEIELNLKSEQDYLSFYSNLQKQFGHIIKDHFYIKLHSPEVYKYLPS